MLRITFKDDPNNKNLLWDPDANFNSLFKPEWLQSDLAKAMVKDVDGSEVVSPYCIESPVLGQISPFMLSGGVKALLLMLNTDYLVWATACGDNCAKWILKIAEVKGDLTICLEHYMEFGEDFRFYNIDTQEVMNSYEDYTTELGW